MGKRHHNESNELEPERKKAATTTGIEPGDILYDITGKQWKLGKSVGEGAFGEIFMASDCTTGNVTEQSPYVAKLELHKNGPLFVETHFYLRVCKTGLINEWKQKNRKTIGMPHYIASGSHTKLSIRYRFLILPKYSIDLQQVFERHGSKFNIKTVLTIALQLLDTLEYIHSCGFIHADIKASNILINEKADPQKWEESEPVTSQYKPSFEVGKSPRLIRSCRMKRTSSRNLRSFKIMQDAFEAQTTSPEVIAPPVKPIQPNIDVNQVYLLDFGLASKYLQSNGEHRPYFADERKAHAGTIFFCSLDAHDGMQSRRSDLESLGYNMIYWLTTVLPWMNNVDDYEMVKKKKQICMQELENFLHFCFGRNIPIFLKNFFKHIKSLKFDAAPDYEYCRKVFIQGFNEYGYKKVFTLDFDNKEGWGHKKKRIKNTENDRRRASVVCSIMRTPLKSNLALRHVLRKKDKAKNRMIRWSQILIDPELIIKSGKRVKERVHDENENADNLANMNIQELNPTETMLEVYNNYVERQKNTELGLPLKEKCNNSPAIEGYNATMMAIYNKILQRESSAEEVVAKVQPVKTSKKKSLKSSKTKSPKKPRKTKSDPKEVQIQAVVVEEVPVRRSTRKPKRRTT